MKTTSYTETWQNRQDALAALEVAKAQEYQKKLKSIQSRLNRAKAQLAQLDMGYVFTKEDADQLRPAYEKIIDKIQTEYDTAKAINIEVVSPKFL